MVKGNKDNAPQFGSFGFLSTSSIWSVKYAEQVLQIGGTYDVTQLKNGWRRENPENK